MKVGILRVGSSDWLGGTYYTKTIANALRTMGHEVCWVTTSANDDGDDADAPVIRAPISRSLTRRAITRLGGGIGHPYPSLELKFWRAGIDVLIPLMFSLGARARVGWVGWIPDFQHVEQPSHFTSSQIAARERGHRLLAMDSPILAFSSLHSASLADDRYRGVRDKTVVLRFAASLDDDAWSAATEVVPPTYGIDEPFVYLPNQFWTHKNHRTVFQAWNLMGGRAPLLVCTGSLNDPRHPGYFDAVKAELSVEAKSRIRILNIVPRNDQIALFRNAAAVLNPSLYEGWSTSVEEGLAFGKQLILSDLPVFREQADSSVRYFSPMSAGALAELIQEMLPSLSTGLDREAELSGKSHHHRRRSCFVESLSLALKCAIR